jgi:spore coat protein U-like protein
MEKLTRNGKKMVRLLLRRQFRRSFFGQILLIISIVPDTHALAGSSSAPLAVTVAVVRSCNIATALPLISDAKTSITPDSIVTILCPHGFSPAITVDSGGYGGEFMTRNRFFAANRTGSVSTKSSTDRPPVESPLPVTSRARRIISFDEPQWDAEKGSYRDNVKVTINF